MAKQLAGQLHVANDVLVDMVVKATQECYGIIGLTQAGPAPDKPKVLSASKAKNGVAIETVSDGIKADVYVIIEYGVNINTVSQNLSSQVEFVLTQYAGVPVAGVEVHVQGVNVSK